MRIFIINNISSKVIMFGSMHTYTSVLDKSLEAERISVSVLGTGPFGLALASRLAEAGAEVRLGSRSVTTNQRPSLYQLDQLEALFQECEQC